MREPRLDLRRIGSQGGDGGCSFSFIGGCPIIFNGHLNGSSGIGLGLGTGGAQGRFNWSVGMQSTLVSGSMASEIRLARYGTTFPLHTRNAASDADVTWHKRRSVLKL